MLTPRGIFIAIAVGCLIASAAMVIFMIIGSPGRTWHRRLDKGAIAFGILMVAFGIWEFTVYRRAEREHRILHYKRAPVTPAQGYAASVLFVAVGSITVVIALLHGRSGS